MVCAMADDLMSVIGDAEQPALPDVGDSPLQPPARRARQMPTKLLQCVCPCGKSSHDGDLVYGAEPAHWGAYVIPKGTDVANVAPADLQDYEVPMGAAPRVDAALVRCLSSSKVISAGGPWRQPGTGSHT